MTRFLDVNAVGALVQSLGIEAVLSEMASYIAHDYRHWGDFDKTPRTANHSDLGVIELMPTSDATLYGFKYVNGHPANTGKGLSTVMAFGVLAEMASGMPLLLSEMTVTTALRTAATSALAAKALARMPARKMAVIGCGAQSEFQIIAFKSMLGIRQFSLYDIDPKAVEKLRRNLSFYNDVEFIIASSTAEAVKDAGIVTTITADKTRATIITPEMVEPGMHFNAVGGDCPGKTELHVDLLRGARIFVEYAPQTRIEGDIQQLPADFPVTELWEVLSGAKAGRQSEGEVTVFDSVGFAIEDFSALRYLHDKATQLNIGSFIDLIPALNNPKDLFNRLKPGRK